MRLHVRTAGAPDAPRTAVLLHGITSSSGTWVRVMPELAARGYRVHAVDTLGHGESPKPYGGYHHDGLVAAIAASVPDEVDLLIGHSFGGFLGAWGALTGLLVPRALVLEDPTHWVPSKEYARRRLQDSEVLPLDVDEYMRTNPGWPRVEAEERVLGLRRLSWSGINAAFVDNAPWDIRGRLVELRERVPSLYVIPAGSDWVLAPDVPGVRHALGEENVVIVPGVGHGIHRDDLPAFLRIVDDFTKRVGL
jgi:pimeloyl-ACP methyl ester carboxylesterase